LGPGPGEVGQGGLKPSTYEITNKKSAPCNQKNFFRVWTGRLATSFEPLNSSLPLSVPEQCACKATCNLVVLERKSLKPAGRRLLRDITREIFKFKEIFNESSAVISCM